MKRIPTSANNRTDWRLSWLMLLALAPSPANADVSADAKRAYSAGDYNKAAALYESQIRKNPRDGMLHYCYANCLLGKHDNSEAAAEYSIAGQLFKDKKMKEYCENLAEQFQYHAPVEGPHYVSPNTRDTIGGGIGGTALLTNDPTKNAKIRAVLRKGEQDASNVMNNAQRQVTSLNGEKAEYSLGRGRFGAPMGDSDEIMNARQRIDDRQVELQELARRQAKDVREQAKRDAQRIAN